MRLRPSRYALCYTSGHTSGISLVGSRQVYLLRKGDAVVKIYLEIALAWIQYELQLSTLLFEFF